MLWNRPFRREARGNASISTVALEAPFSFSPCSWLFIPWLWELVSMNWRGRLFPQQANQSMRFCLVLVMSSKSWYFQDIVRQWCLRHSPFEGLNVEHANWVNSETFTLHFTMSSYGNRLSKISQQWWGLFMSHSSCSSSDSCASPYNSLFGAGVECTGAGVEGAPLAIAFEDGSPESQT